jgi:hypothetical protein
MKYREGGEFFKHVSLSGGGEVGVVGKDIHSFWTKNIDTLVMCRRTLKSRKVQEEFKQLENVKRRGCPRHVVCYTYKFKISLIS